MHLQGIKVLSLFFIDADRCRGYDEAGNPMKGIMPE